MVPFLSGAFRQVNDSLAFRWQSKAALIVHETFTFHRKDQPSSVWEQRPYATVNSRFGVDVDIVSDLEVGGAQSCAGRQRRLWTDGEAGQLPRRHDARLQEHVGVLLRELLSGGQGGLKAVGRNTESWALVTGGS